LLRAPYRPDFAEAKPPDIDIAPLGIPTDLGVTNRSGARFGLAQFEIWSASALTSTSFAWRRLRIYRLPL
jgi:arginase family enzyme